MPDSSTVIESIVVDSKYFTTRRAFHFLAFLVLHTIIPIAINLAAVVVPLYKPTSGFSVHNLSFVFWFGLLLPLNSCFFLSVWTAYFCNETGLLPWTINLPPVYGVHTLTLIILQFGMYAHYFSHKYSSFSFCHCLLGQTVEMAADAFPFPLLYPLLGVISWWTTTVPMYFINLKTLKKHNPGHIDKFKVTYTLRTHLSAAQKALQTHAYTQYFQTYTLHTTHHAPQPHPYHTTLQQHSYTQTHSHTLTRIEKLQTGTPFCGWCFLLFCGIVTLHDWLCCRKDICATNINTRGVFECHTIGKGKCTLA